MSLYRSISLQKCRWGTSLDVVLDLFGRFKVISVNLYDPFVVREKYYAKK
jgi:hypothetical protein